MKGYLTVKTGGIMRWVLVAGLLSMGSFAAVAEPIDVRGATVNFTNPAGYCSLGDSPEERELAARAKSLSSGRSEVVYVAVRCSELKEFRLSKRDDFDHWLMVQLLASRRGFVKVPIERERFVEAIARETPKLDKAELDEKLKSVMGDPEAHFQGMDARMIGHDKDGAFMLVRGVMVRKSGKFDFICLGAITVVKSWPLSVGVYTAAKDKKGQSELRPALLEALNNLVSEN